MSHISRTNGRDGTGRLNDRLTERPEDLFQLVLLNADVELSQNELILEGYICIYINFILFSCTTQSVKTKREYLHHARNGLSIGLKEVHQ